MNYDLKIIKKKFGENMMKLSRELFPTLLEEEGLLSGILLDNFNPSKTLYDDIKKNCLEKEFKMFIYSFLNRDEVIENSKKNPKELFEEAGYDFYECKTEEDIQKFKKYYAKGEELCTFRGKRLDICYVFFAVKKNVNDIKRENFSNPIREDEYGTSVMSIQFTRDEAHTLSIKNRYNHTITNCNPDATYHNNLENIIPGLTKSFENEYDLIQFNPSTDFEMKNYVRGRDGKFYKYNYEINNVYYCTDNVIIDNYEVKKLEKERYILLDYFIIDLKEKNIILYDNEIGDSFPKCIDNIIRIDVINDSPYKKIIIVGENGNMIIKIDHNNRIIELENDAAKKIENDFFNKSKYIKKLYMNNVKTIGNRFLNRNKSLEEISFENLEEIGDNFLEYNESLNNLPLENVKKIGNSFMFYNKNLELKKMTMKNVVEIGNSFMFINNSIEEVNFPNIQKIGDNAFFSNKTLRKIHFPRIISVGDCFLENNNLVTQIYFPNVRKIGINFLKNNQIMKEIYMPNVIEIEDGFLQCNTSLNELNISSAKKIGNKFMQYNNLLTEFDAENLEEIGSEFFEYNRSLRKLILPSLKTIGNNSLSFNNIIGLINLENIKYESFQRLPKYIKQLIEKEYIYILR